MNKVEKLIVTSDKYIKSMDAEDLAAVKFCASSLGVLLGIGVPLKLKKPAGLLAGLLFAGTWLPLISRFVDLSRQQEPEVIPVAPVEEPK